MKPIPTIAAGILAVFLVLSPVLASAATTYTLSVSTDKSSYTGTTTGTITFGASPGPGSGTSVQFVITNPTSTEVWSDAVSVSAAGAATDTFGTAGWKVSGTYTVTATWAPSVGATVQTATTTFSYAASATTPSTSSGLPPFTVRVIAPSEAYPGETVGVFIETTYNGSLIGNATSITFHAHVWTISSGSATTATFNALGTPSNFATGHYVVSWTVPANSAIGQVQWVHVPATCVAGNCRGYSTTGVAGITVVPSQVLDGSLATSAQVNALSQAVASLTTNVQTIASAWPQMAATVASLGQNVSSLSSSLSTINSNFNTLSQSVQSATNAVSGLQSTLTNIQTSIGTISSGMNTLQSDVQGTMSTVQGLSGLQTSVSSLSNTVSNEQTYILVVAAIAAVTLVLELAILIRKMS